MWLLIGGLFIVPYEVFNRHFLTFKLFSISWIKTLIASVPIGVRYPGFNILKLRARGGMPVAFADFEVFYQ